MTVGDGVKKVCSNSRRAKAVSTHSAGAWAGATGAVVAAKGLKPASTKLVTIPATMLTGVATVVVAGCCETSASAALGIVVALITGVVAAAETMGVIALGLCTAHRGRC